MHSPADEVTDRADEVTSRADEVTTNGADERTPMSILRIDIGGKESCMSG